MSLIKLIHIAHLLRLKRFIYIAVMVERLKGILRECFLDHAVANLDIHPSRTASISVLPASQRRVVYRLMGTNSIARGAS